MRCDRCGRDAIIFQRYSGLHLCEAHFQEDLVARAKRTIRSRGWIRPGDRIAIALSGGKDSSALLHFLSTHFGMRRDLSFVALTVDEGIRGYRDLERIGEIARKRGVEWASTSFAREFGATLEDILAVRGERLSCSYCGVLRRQALNSLALRAGATKLALGANLDDEAQSVLLNVLRGDAVHLTRRVRPTEGLVPRIKPFLRIPERDVALYALLCAPDHERGRCPHAGNALRGEIRRILNEYAYRHPGTKFALVNLAESLRARAGAEDRDPGSRREPGASRGDGAPLEQELHVCERCGRPCATSCIACEILDGVSGRG